MLTQCCGPAPVDLVHRSTADRSKGYAPFRSGLSVPIGRPRSHAGDGRWGDDGARRRRRTAARRSNTGKRLRCAKFESKYMERKRRRRGSLPRGPRGGGSTGDGGPAAVTAGGGGAPLRRRCGEGGEEWRGAGWRGDPDAPL
jgi:hypothetical protein